MIKKIGKAAIGLDKRKATPVTHIIKENDSVSPHITGTQRVFYANCEIILGIMCNDKKIGERQRLISEKLKLHLLLVIVVLPRRPPATPLLFSLPCPY